MNDIKILQKPLEELVNVIFVSHPIDIGKFTVTILYDILPTVKKKLNLDFDDITIYPGAQPRESGDVVLYKNKNLIKRISVKTAVIGDIKTTLDKLWPDLERNLDGIIIATYTCESLETKKTLLKLIFIYLPSEVNRYPKIDVLFEVQRKFKEKASKENCKDFRPLAINDAVLFEHLRRALLAEQEAKKAYQGSIEARDEARSAHQAAVEAKEMARSAHQAAVEAKEMAEKAYQEVRKVYENVQKDMQKLDKKLDETLKFIKKLSDKS